MNPPSIHPSITDLLVPRKTEDVAEPGRVDRLVARLKDTSARALEWRERHKRFEPASFFVGGFVWDATTLQRIDAVVDNVLLSAYLLALGALIAGAVLVQADRATHRILVKHREALPAVVQFFMGALFSAYVIFYFQSASLTSTSVFVILLLALLIANEFIHRRLVNVYLLTGLYFLAAFSFFVFFVPVVTRTMNYLSFLAGGAISAGIVIALLAYLRRRGVFERRREFLYALGVVGLLLATLNVFYLKNWIPPVPLALRHAGVYHDVTRAGDVYELTRAASAWYWFGNIDAIPLRLEDGEAVYCFAAVFAPTALRTGIYHEWRHFDETRGEWMTTDRIPYEIEGRRAAGYRGYTFKRNVAPGTWRVDIRTSDDRTLGRVRFRVERNADTPRRLETLVYD